MLGNLVLQELHASRELLHAIDTVFDADPAVEAFALQFGEDGVVVVEALDELPAGSRGVCVSEFGETAAIAVLKDEGLGFGEFSLVPEQPGAMKVDVREVEGHRSAFGDLLGCGQMALGGGGVAEQGLPVRGGEQDWRKVLDLTGFAEAIEGAGEVGIGVGSGRLGS